MNRITRLAAVSVVLTLLAASPLHAQDAMRDIEVPGTRTFPGIENPAFPYPQPEEGRRIAAVGRAGEVDVRP